MYPSDLSDSSWETIEGSLAIPGMTQRRRIRSLRQMINAVLYVVDNVVKWRNLPNNFSPWKTVHSQFRRWSKSGVWKDVSLIMNGLAPLFEGRESSPIACQYPLAKSDS